MAEPQLQNVALLRMDRPDHACPWGLKALRRLQEQQIPFEDHRLTTDAEVQAFKAQHQVATTPQIFSNGKGIGGYSDLAALLQVKPEAGDISYTPVVAVFATARLVNIATGGDVMGFLKYDLLSQRLPLYARLYPGLELLVALLLCIAGMISVTKAVFIDKLALNCACVGGNSRTPLGVVSFAENLMMADIGGALLLSISAMA